MTARPPVTPRLLTADEATAYMGVKSRHSLDRVPVRPVRIGGRVLWDRLALDAWLDGLAGLLPTVPPTAANDVQTDPDAALKAWQAEHGSNAAPGRP